MWQGGGGATVQEAAGPRAHGVALLDRVLNRAFQDGCEKTVLFFFLFPGRVGIVGGGASV